MSFAYPGALVGLILPAALLVWVWRGDKRRLVLPLDHALLPSRNWLGLLLGTAESLPAVLLAVAVLLLAGPQRLGVPQAKRALTNIEFCVDVSGSMGTPFGEGTRYDASMAAIDAFLDYRRGDDFGLTFFGNNVLHWTPLTSDPSALRCSPPFMRPEVVPYWLGGTEIGKALMACRQVLTSRQEGDRMVILVSDGFSFDLVNGADLELARKLVADKIVVYAVHIGDGDAPDPIVNITALTGGDVFVPGDAAGLEAVFQRIDQMQEAKLERSTPEPQDNFFPYCVVGLAALGGSALSLWGLRFTPW